MFDIPDWLYEYLMKYKKKDIIEIMSDALDMMQGYNNQSVTFCIVSSIPGAICTETETGCTYQLPTGIK